MMETLSKDIFPYSLKRKQWDGVRKYLFTVSQNKKIGDEKSSLQCRIPLTLVMTQWYEKSAVYRLKMSRPIFNGSRDYDTLQWVFAKLMSVSREVHIRTRKNGSIWEILNKQQIRSRWGHVQKQIMEIYEDPRVDDILAQYEQNLTHHFQSMYKQDTMMQFVFNDLFRDYSEDEYAKRNKTLSRHLGDLPFPIIEGKQLSELNSQRRWATITMEGRPDINKADQEAINAYFGDVLEEAPAIPYAFTYKGKYQMDTTRGCIQEASLGVEGVLGKAYSKKTNYHLIQANHE